MKINDLSEDLGNWIARKGLLGAQAGVLAKREYSKNLASKAISKEFLSDFKRNFDSAVESGLVDVKATMVEPGNPQGEEKVEAPDTEQNQQNQPSTNASDAHQPPTQSPGSKSTTPTQNPAPANKTKPLKTVKVGNEVITKKRDGKWYDQEDEVITNQKEIGRLEQLATPAMASSFVKESEINYGQFNRLFESAMRGEILSEQDDVMSPGEWAEQYLVSKLGERKLTPKLKINLQKLVKIFSEKVNSTGNFPEDVAEQMFKYLMTVASIVPSNSSQKNKSANVVPEREPNDDVITQVNSVFKTIKSVDNIPGAAAYLIDIVMDNTGKTMDQVMDIVATKVKKASDAREAQKKAK